MTDVEQLATGIYTSVLGPSRDYKTPTCKYKDEFVVACAWNAFYSPKECAYLRQSNLDANSFTGLSLLKGAFCDIKLGCSRNATDTARKPINQR